MILLILSVLMDNSVSSTDGELHDQADAKWIVIRGLLWGHDECFKVTPCGQPTPSQRIGP
jgi:hypothetical protein